jgi:benzoate membrane transport protein
MPVSVAWSTPGAALLIAAGPVHGGYRAALGAFVVAGLLTVGAGMARPFERLVASIPGPVASGLLAGVLLPICLAPARAVVSLPALAAPVVVTWAVMRAIRPRVAVPGALGRGSRGRQARPPARTGKSRLGRRRVRGEIPVHAHRMH